MAFLDCRKKICGKIGSLTDQPRSGYHLMETREGLNHDLSVETEDNSIEKITIKNK
jgi:hypothetical protein